MEMKTIFTCLVALFLFIDINGVSGNPRKKRQEAAAIDEPTTTSSSVPESSSSTARSESTNCTTPKGEEGDCMPLVACVSHFKTLEDFERSVGEECEEALVCCPRRLRFRIPELTPFRSWVPLRWLDSPVAAFPPVSYAKNAPPVTRVTAEELEEISEKANETTTTQLDELERQLIARNLVVQPGSVEASHADFFGNNPEARELAKDGQVAVKSTEAVLRKIDVAVNTSYFLDEFDLDLTENPPPLGSSEDDSSTEATPKGDSPVHAPPASPLIPTPPKRRPGIISTIPRFHSLAEVVVQEDNCPPKPSCPEAKYRTMNGSCNNLANPMWGQSLTPFQRLLPNAYADGFNMPRNDAKDGSPLPNPREISTGIAHDQDNPMQRFTNLFQQFGQFLDHDITLTAISRLQNGFGISCCNSEIQADPSLRHQDCFEIKIPANDSFYSQFRQTCINFVRSAPAPRPSCAFGPREQMNQLTSYIDGSQIYGSSEAEMRNLRSFSGGRLRVSEMNGGEFLPQKSQTAGCGIPLPTNKRCFIAGDVRVDENSLLSTLQTVWLREHNRIADELSSLNPDWSDETVFQETRRIVGAELQHITYNEFLPLVLGPQITNTFKLSPRFSGFSTSYDPQLNGGSLNAFASAAFRFGHSMVQGIIELRDTKDNVTDRLALKSQFNNPELLHEPGKLDSIIRGCTSQRSQTMDSFFSDQLTKHLFEPPGAGFGLDLVAFNIQRGRDHGLPPYNEWRSACGLSRFNSFDEMATAMRKETAESFGKIYKHVDDVDLYIAGVSELPTHGGAVGPTFTCILTEQFKRYKFGDRFWYENGGMLSSFTEAQLKEIRKVSLARVLCDNADDLEKMQPLALIRPSMWNPKLSCKTSKIPRMNLQHWKSESTN